MKIVCQIYRGQLTGECSLDQLAPYATNFYSYRPRMLRFRRNGITLLIFTSLRFRLMGGGDQHITVLREFLKRVPWQLKASSLQMSAFTVVHSLDQTINIHKLDPTY